MAAYYNDNDAYCAEWLRNLIAAGLIPPGDVDERSITDVKADDLKGYEQCHFFAGITGWPLALQLAGWEGPVWTGSCPCQPLSSAGQRKGHADERHLWPAFYALIAEYRPATVFGEQVASKDGREWLAGLRADMEHLGYAVGAADMPAASVGAPHIRQRLWWVADAGHAERRAGDRPRDPQGRDVLRQGWQESAVEPGQCGEDGGVAESDGGNTGTEGLQRGGEYGQQPQDGGIDGGMGDASEPGLPPCERKALVGEGRRPEGRAALQSGGSFWPDYDLIPCADGKARRVEPGTFPLAHGVPNRVGRLRAYGNAIVPQVAEVILAP